MKWKEGAASAPTNSINTSDIHKFMDLCKTNNWNLIRLVVYQEVYEGHRAAFFAELKAIIEAAQQLGIAVIIDNHQWRIGGAAYPDSIGVPRKYLAGYNINGDPASYDSANGVSQDAVAWWRDLYANNLRQFRNVYEDLAKYFEDIIGSVDRYDNVIGYEILNEPQTSQPTDYDSMGKLNDFIAARIRAKTTKRVIYCRDNGIGAWKPKNAERPKLIPDEPNIAYDNHSYSLKRMSTYPAENATATANRSDVDVFLGEWAAQTQFDPTNTLTLENTKFVLGLCKRHGYALAWWAIGHFGAGPWKKLANPDGTLRDEGKVYSQAIREIYA